MTQRGLDPSLKHRKPAKKEKKNSYFNFLLGSIRFLSLLFIFRAFPRAGREVLNRVSGESRDAVTGWLFGAGEIWDKLDGMWGWESLARAKRAEIPPWGRWASQSLTSLCIFPHKGGKSPKSSQNPLNHHREKKNPIRKRRQSWKGSCEKNGDEL